LLRAMIPKGVNDLFFVGDGHQRIYGKHRAVMSHTGIDIRGRSRKLYLNYRTTDEIRQRAVALLEGRDIDDLDGGSDDNRRYKSLSHGAAPQILGASDLDEALRLAAQSVKEWRRQQNPDQPLAICVMTYTTAIRNAVAAMLTADGIEVKTVEADSTDTSDTAMVRVSTMHRAKGLEFDRVVVLDVGRPRHLTDDDAARLRYVALTRAKSTAALIEQG